MHVRMLLAAAVVAGTAAAGSAAVKTEVVEYTFDGTTLKGLVAYDDATKEKRPGVLVVHEWWGLNEYAKDRAKQLAGMGYVAFAADMYGDGKVTDHPDKAKEFATAVRSNSAAWVGRAKAALKVLQDNPLVDPTKVAAIGYCFGGSTALQLAYSGADLAAAVSFHGAPVPPTPEQAKAVRAKVLVCHGEADPFIPKAAMDKMLAALKAGGVAVEYAGYPGVVHSFTVPGADKVGNPGMKYDATADKESWAAMTKLFAAAFGK
jgi:dienelactone hydrolase